MEDRTKRIGLFISANIWLIFWFVDSWIYYANLHELSPPVWFFIFILGYVVLMYKATSDK